MRRHLISRSTAAGAPSGPASAATTGIGPVTRSPLPSDSPSAVGPVTGVAPAPAATTGIGPVPGSPPASVATAGIGPVSGSPPAPAATTGIGPVTRSPLPSDSPSAVGPVTGVAPASAATTGIGPVSGSPPASVATTGIGPVTGSTDPASTDDMVGSVVRLQRDRRIAVLSLAPRPGRSLERGRLRPPGARSVDRVISSAPREVAGAWPVATPRGAERGSGARSRPDTRVGSRHSRRERAVIS